MKPRHRTPSLTTPAATLAIVASLAALLPACSSEPSAAGEAAPPESATAPAPAAHETPETPPAAPAAVQSITLEGLAKLHRVGHVLLGAQPDEVAFEALASEGTTRVIDLRGAAEDRGLDEAEVMDVLQLEYVSLPVSGPDDLTDELFDEARRLLREHDGGGQGDVLLHCASSNRVGAVWLTRRVLDEGVPLEQAVEEAHQVGLRSQALEDAAKAYILGAGKKDLGAYKLEIRSELPEVAGIDVPSLAQRLEQGDAPLLLDVRAEDEYAVSHLPGARRAETLSDALALLEGTPKDEEVVLYCSIGYRSGHLARALMQAGYTGVRNLEGSIFEWANTGHAVERDGRPVRQVHPYDETWGRLLDRELWAGLDG